MIQRKNKADTYLVGFQGMRISAASANARSAATPFSSTTLEVLERGLTLDDTLSAARAIETAHLLDGHSDAMHSEYLAQESFRESRLALTRAGYIGPGDELFGFDGEQISG